MQNKLTISNTLIALSILFTVVAGLYPDLYILGINRFFLERGDFWIYPLQFFSGTFLHGGFLHLFMNSVFIYYFGNILEALIGKKKFLIFFIFTTIFIGVLITNISGGNTVGISGFAMALLTYYTLELKSRNNPEYKGGITALIINIGIGLYPGVSLYGHLFGAVAGILFYFFNKEFLRKKLVGLIVSNKKESFEF